MKCNAIALLVGALALGGCGDSRDEDTPSLTGDDTTGGAGDDDDDDDDETDDFGEKLDVVGGDDDDDLPVGCGGDSNCELIDILFVIDNSATMGEEQLNLAANFPRLVERLQSLDGEDGAIRADVNIMVTTSDFGHPLCTDFYKEGYAPRRGAPVYTGCNERLESFTSAHTYNPTSIPQACTNECPSDIVPGGDPFIHFDSSGSNVPMGNVAGALSCVAPQGIEGCGYEAPLETMLQSLRPEACWNDDDAPGCEDDEDWGWVGRGFLRRGSTLAIAIITDEADCSVAAPDGFSWFTDSDNKKYWAKDPASGIKAPSSAVCWKSGVECTDEDDDGVYESCEARADSDALHSTQRYIEFLDYMEKEHHHDVVMLGVLGVPPVTKREDRPPFEAIEGGIADLEYRKWRDGEYGDEDGDILPGEWNKGITAADKQWEFGIGPGCTGKTIITTENEDGEMVEEEVFTGQAVPPVRIREVCESLDEVDATGQMRRRCCIESICDDDFSPAIDCLTGIIQETINPVG